GDWWGGGGGRGVGREVVGGGWWKSTAPVGGRLWQGRLDTGGLNEPPLLLRVMRPHAGEAVGLQLDPNLELIGLTLVEAALRLLNLRQNTKQILYVVANLVRNHVSLRELAALASNIASAETLQEILKECGIEINLPIIGTIERAHGGLGKATCRARGSGEHDQRRAFVGFAGLCENLFPLDFRASKHSRYELTHLIGW